MKHAKIISLALLLAVVGSVAAVSLALANPNQPQETDTDQPQTPDTMPKFDLPEHIRDGVIAYIGSNHSETTQFMNIQSWTGGRQETGLLGSETYIYQAQGWAVTIQYPVIPDPTYSVTVEYSVASGSIGIPYHVSWQGTWNDGCITEASYTFAQ